MTDRFMREHAALLLRTELSRRRAALDRLPGDGAAVVETTAGKAVTAAVEAVLDQSRRDPFLADALAYAYAERSVPGANPAAAAGLHIGRAQT